MGDTVNDDTTGSELLKVVSTALFDYSNNPYILNKLKDIINGIPRQLEVMKREHEQRILRAHVLTENKESFTKVFMENNQYFYLNARGNEMFFHYDGEHFYHTDENNILYKLFTCINDGKELMPWKYKTKVSIVKKIKERSFLNVIPESRTIQFVLGKLHPLFFTTKSEAKYFLTVIGDCILKKAETQNLHHFVYPKARPFLKYLEFYINYHIGKVDCIGTLKTKYYEHAYDTMRVLNVRKSVENSEYWESFIEKNVLDIIAVSCHYSHRYKCSDKFIKDNRRGELKNYTFFFKDRTRMDVIKMFSNQYLESSEESNVQWKHMVFLWKQFIEGKHFPSVISQSNLKFHLVEHFSSGNGVSSDLSGNCIDIVPNVRSSYLEHVFVFQKFWSECMKCEEDDELEINEVISLFEEHVGVPCEYEEDELVRIIRYCIGNNVVNQDNKYVLHVKCSLWDKKQEIEHCLKRYKDFYSDENHDSLSLYDVYEYYVDTYVPTYGKEHIMSKQYFSKYWQVACT